jgi:hypothetical protein
MQKKKVYFTSEGKPYTDRAIYKVIRDIGYVTPNIRAAVLVNFAGNPALYFDTNFILQFNTDKKIIPLNFFISASTTTTNEVNIQTPYYWVFRSSGNYSASTDRETDYLKTALKFWNNAQRIFYTSEKQCNTYLDHQKVLVSDDDFLNVEGCMQLFPTGLMGYALGGKDYTYNKIGSIPTGAYTVALGFTYYEML